MFPKVCISARQEGILRGRRYTLTHRGARYLFPSSLPSTGNVVGWFVQSTTRLDELGPAIADTGNRNRASLAGRLIVTLVGVGYLHSDEVLLQLVLMHTGGYGESIIQRSMTSKTKTQRLTESVINSYPRPASIHDMIGCYRLSKPSTRTTSCTLRICLYCAVRINYLTCGIENDP